MNRFDQDLNRAAERLATEPLPEGVLDETLDGLTPDGAQWRRVMAVIGVAGVIVLVMSFGLGQMMAALGPAPTPAPTPDRTLAPSPSATATEAASPEPTPAELVEPGAVAASVEQDGIRVTLELDRGQVSQGDRVWATVTIENLGADIIVWGHSSTCDYAAGVAAHPEQPEPLKYGRSDWPENAGIFKTLAAWVPDPDFGYGFIPEGSVGRVTGFGCTTDRVRDEVPPGGTLTFRGAWDVVHTNCMPAPPGEYSVRSGFTYDGRGDREPLGTYDELLTITVTVPLRVLGATVDYLSPGEAVDAALGDPDFAAQFGSIPRSRWAGIELEFEEADWSLRHNLEAPDQALVAQIDAVSGIVSEVGLISRTGPHSLRTQCSRP